MLPEGDRTFHTTAWSKGSTFPNASETPLTNVGAFYTHLQSKKNDFVYFYFVCMSSIFQLIQELGTAIIKQYKAEYSIPESTRVPLSEVCINYII